MTVPAYTLIVPSASRPHLLGPALDSLLANVDEKPARLVVHDDAAFPGKQGEVRSVCERLVAVHGVPLVFQGDDPPKLHGPSLAWLLEQVHTEYFLYTQDDLQVVRPLPIATALATMHAHGLHHIRFNKRATMGWKANWQKKEYTYTLRDDCPHGVGLCTGACSRDVTLTVSDHWYFQTALGRTERLRPVTRWYMAHAHQGFGEHCEPKMNNAMNRGVPDFTTWAVANGYALPPAHAACMQQDVRAAHLRTFIYGPIGEPPYIANLATSPDDWALPRSRGGTGPARVDTQARG